MRRFAIALFLALALGGIAAAQTAETAEPPAPDPETLAEIRLEIQGLARILGELQQELIAPDPDATGIINPAPLRDRVTQTTQELQRLQASIETLEARVERIVADGNNRVGDLEFRLLELEGGDYSAYRDPPPLGEGDPTPRAGTAAAETATAAVDVGVPRPITRSPPGQVVDAGPAPTPRPEAETPLPGIVAQPPLDLTEQGRFNAALELYESGDYPRASAAFEQFLAAFPGGPLSGEASYWRGESLAAQGNWNQAARSYLNSFSGAPQGDKAPEALFRLGLALGRLGQTNEACLTLAEVPRRYPSIPADLAAQTEAERQALRCG